MPTDQEPIPPEALPPGWGPAGSDTERIAYRHSQPRIELSAAMTEAAQSHPSLGLERCWELRYEYDIGEIVVDDPICLVSTRHAAVNGLLKCMDRVQTTLNDGGDPMDFKQALDDARFKDVIPNEISSRRNRGPA